MANERAIAKLPKIRLARASILFPLNGFSSNVFPLDLDEKG
jgi:hypothetical protein